MNISQFTIYEQPTVTVIFSKLYRVQEPIPACTAWTGGQSITGSPRKDLSHVQTYINVMVVSHVGLMSE